MRSLSASKRKFTAKWQSQQNPIFFTASAGQNSPHSLPNKRDKILNVKQMSVGRNIAEAEQQEELNDFKE